MHRHTRTLLGTTLAILFAGWAAAGAAFAVTVTFDVGAGGLLSSYTENGMTVSPVLGFHVVDVADHDANASRDLLNRPVCCTTPYEFTYSGGAFSVAKFDFVLNAGPHVFTSSLGATVTPGASGLVTPPAVGWTGITSFRWDANGTSGGTDTALMDNLKFCPGDCNDGNPCTTDSCDPDDGGADGNGCIHTANAAPCDDGLFCNGADTCSGGGCSVHAGDPCTAGPECNNSCNEGADNCLVTAGTACTDDGNVCTNDQCNGTGSCVHPNNTAPCSDGTFCNGTDTCSGGSCVVHAGNPCTGGSECANLCNEGAQDCFRPVTTSCTSDGNVCTDDHCDGAGACVHPNNTASCNDGSICTTADQCSGGSCVGGSPLNCNDNNACTADSCDSINGCQHDAAANNGQPCDDNNTCTDPDTCNNGTCSGTPLPQNCNDGNPCTLDLCNPLGGCTHDAAALDGIACDDNNTCTQNDMCDTGVCHGVLAEADTDGDGFCDRVENDANCNPNDFAEIPPQSTAFAGAPGLGQGEGIIAYHAPGFEKIPVATDPACQAAGVCGPIGFCTSGKISDPCLANSDCDQPLNTCTVVVNWGNVDNLTFIFAKMNRTAITGFTPVTRGCTRKVQVALEPNRVVNRLKLKASGVLLGRPRRDRDRFQFQNFP